MTALTVHRHAERMAVCQLAADAPVPDWAAAPDRTAVPDRPDRTAGPGTLRAAIRNSAELTIVCAMSAVPADVRHEGPFTAFEVVGPLDLAQTGVLAAVLAPLAAVAVSVFTLSTFHTNWVLVPSVQHEAASRALQRAGHTVLSSGKGQADAHHQDQPQDPGRTPQ